MDSLQFTYWLKGYFEVAEPNTLGEKEIHIIRQHLDLVFNKVTTDYYDTTDYPDPFQGYVRVSDNCSTFSDGTSCGIFYFPEMYCDESQDEVKSPHTDSYVYTALNSDGWLTWGNIDAESDIDAIQKLRSSGLNPIKIPQIDVVNNRTSITTYC